MNLEEYIQTLREVQTSLESDVETLEAIADELEQIKSNVEGASGFFEIQEALDELDNLTSDTEDLIIEDMKNISAQWDPEAWKDELGELVVFKRE